MVDMNLEEIMEKANLVDYQFPGYDVNTGRQHFSANHDFAIKCWNKSVQGLTPEELNLWKKGLERGDDIYVYIDRKMNDPNSRVLRDVKARTFPRGRGVYDLTIIFYMGKPTIR